MTADWARRASARLKLATTSTIVLVRGAEGHHLRAAVLGLEDAFGQVEVALSVTDFLRLRPGSTALLCLRREEWPRLNEVRPVAQQRALKLLLVPLASQGGVAAARNDAPDFLDWTSYVVEADTDVAAVEHAGIEAARGVLPGVIWRGRALDEVLAALGIEFQVLSAKRKHADLDTALGASTAEAILWTDAEDRYERRRIEWVLALSERRPALSLIELPSQVGDWSIVDARVLEPWALRDEGRTAPEIVRYGCAAAGSLKPSELLSRGDGVTRLPDQRGSDAANMALDESHLDTAEHVLSKETSERDGATSARLFVAQGRYEDASDILEGSLERRRAEPDSPQEVAATLQALGSLLMKQGRYADAEKAYEDVISIDESVYGTRQHASVAASLHGLANVLEIQGRYADAEKAYEEVIDIKESVYGTRQHAEVAASLHGLANVLESQGRYADAEKAYEEVIAIEQRTFGSRRTPASLTTLIALTNLLVQQSRTQDALPIARDAWEGALEHHSPLDAVRAGPVLVELLVALGHADEAKEVNAKVAPMLQQLPEDHPMRIAAEKRLRVRS